jgi:hypothetical protein
MRWFGSRVARIGAVSVLSVAALAAAAVPADAARPPPTGVPALVGIVRDGCTNAKVAGLVVTLTNTTTGAVAVPDKTTVGKFTFKLGDPGPVQLQVSAPGYAALGDPAAPGVPVTAEPGPIALPSPQQMAIGLVTHISLAPNPLPANCPFAAKHPPSPNALVGTVRDATTRAKIPNLSVTVTVNPGPVQSPSKVTTGHFVFATVDPGPISLQLTAPGYPALGDPAAPGVTVIRDPGPISLPAVQRMSIGLVAQIVL